MPQSDSLRETLRSQLPHSLERTGMPSLGSRQEGKVRDIYARDGELFLVATDRLSAFDRVLTTVPFKGEVLTRIASYWFERTRDIVQNHMIDLPDPQVMHVRRCRPIPVEMVVRGYLTGSLWRDYQASRHGAYGLDLPEGMSRDEAFDTPILTPTTKAAAGEHDQPISREEILAHGLVSEEIYEECERVALALYERGVALSRERGLILVETKYELGLIGDEVVLMDEIHTPDSSRYWVASEYESRLSSGKAQRMLDKENIRQWLIEERGYRGEGSPPEIPDELRLDLSTIYLEAYRQITGSLMPLRPGPVEERIATNLRSAGYL